jgi:uroporphyrinogen-III synthase
VSGLVLILRPQPGAGETAARARALGLEPVVAPLFELAPVAWQAPDPASVDALLLTSAQGARLAGPQLADFAALPCFAVGEATASAARRAGLEVAGTGSGDGAAALALAAAAGARRILHLCGREHVPVSHPRLRIERRAVYAAEPVVALPEAAADALQRGALALIHSPRAASTFAALTAERGRIRLAAISAGAAAAAGGGWAATAVAAEPRDEALLELAVKLCKTGRPGEPGALAR